MELLIVLFFCILLGVIVWLLISHPRTLIAALALLLLVASCYDADAADCPNASPPGCIASGAALPTAREGMAGRGSASVPAGTWFLLGLIAMTAYAAMLERKTRKLRELVNELEKAKAPPFAVADIAAIVPDLDDEAMKRYLHIEFTSLAGMADFSSWLAAHRQKLKRDGWPAVLQ